MTTRYACLFAQEFPLQALLRLRPELQRKAVAVLDGEPPFEHVCSLNHSARAIGVEPGMTKLEMEMFPAAVVLQRSRTEEAAARAALLECAGSFSPRVEDQSSDRCFTCVIDITGTETLFGSPDTLGENLLKKTQALGIRASIAISCNFHAARCLARAVIGVRVVPRGTECKALAPLPLTVLDLSPEHAETFSMWGITTLGALGNLAETELIARLGQAGKELRLLARGESPHLFSADRAQPRAPGTHGIGLASRPARFAAFYPGGDARPAHCAGSITHTGAGLDYARPGSGRRHFAFPHGAACAAKYRAKTMAQTHSSGSAGPSTPGCDPVSFFERTARQHQQSAARTFFSPGTGANAARCNPGQDSQYCRRGLRRPGSAQRHQPPRRFSYRTICCVLVDCESSASRPTAPRHAPATATGNSNRDCLQ